MKNLIKTISIILLILISLLGLSFYQTNKIYHEVQKVSFSEVMDKKEDDNIYFFYSLGQSNTESIQQRINKFYNEITNLGYDFYMVDMSLDENLKYSSSYPTDPGVNPYPLVSDIKTPEDIFISQVPALLYVHEGEVIDFQEGSANIIYMMNDILENAGSDLSLDTK